MNSLIFWVNMGECIIFIKTNFKANGLWSNLIYLSIWFGHSQMWIEPSHLKIADFETCF